MADQWDSDASKTQWGALGPQGDPNNDSDDRPTYEPGPPCHTFLLLVLLLVLVMIMKAAAEVVERNMETPKNLHTIMIDSNQK